MKKILGITLSLVLIFTCALGLTACGKPQGKILTKSDYAQAFTCVDSSYNQFLAGTAAASAMNAVADTDLVDVANDGQQARMCGALMWYVRFLKNVCENAQFTLTDSYVDCDIVDTYGEAYLTRFKMSYDEETNIITSDVYCEDDRSYVYYLVFEIDYNFDTETLNSFVLHGYMGPETATAVGVNYFLFENVALRTYNTQAQSFAAFAAQEIQNMQTISAVDWASERVDYSDEYNSAAPQA